MKLILSNALKFVQDPSLLKVKGCYVCSNTNEPIILIVMSCAEAKTARMRGALIEQGIAAPNGIKPRRHVFCRRWKRVWRPTDLLYQRITSNSRLWLRRYGSGRLIWTWVKGSLWSGLQVARGATTVLLCWKGAGNLLKNCWKSVQSEVINGEFTLWKICRCSRRQAAYTPLLHAI